MSTKVSKYVFLFENNGKKFVYNSIIVSFSIGSNITGI